MIDVVPPNPCVKIKIHRMLLSVEVFGFEDGSAWARGSLKSLEQLPWEPSTFKVTDDEPRGTKGRVVGPIEGGWESRMAELRIVYRGWAFASSGPSSQ